MTSKNSDPHQIEATARSVLRYRQHFKNHRSKNTNTINQLLTAPKEKLKDLMDLIVRDHSIKSKVIDCCPSNFHSSIQTCHLENNKLVILVSSGAAATQLKYYTTDILTKLRQNGLWEIATVLVKVSATL